MTYVGSTVEDLLAGGAGVCQDFAHLALLLLRRNGIAARYVSGYLFAPRSGDGDGDSAEVDTHAWVEALLPRAEGEPVWVGVDPTNRHLTGERHVKIGHGRHYADVPPVKGVYRGAAGSHLEASVRMSGPTLASVRDAARRPQRLRGPRPRRCSTRSAPPSRAGGAAARRPHRRRPPPLGVHARRRAGRAGRGRLRGRARRRSRASTCAPTGRAPARRRRRRGAGRLPRRRPTAAPRCAEALVLADRLGAELGLPVYLYGDARGRAHARASCGGRARSTACAPDFGPPRAAPDRGRGARRRAAAARGLQRRARAAGDARGRARDRGGDPRGRGGGPAVRARARPAAAQRRRGPGLDEHRGPPGDDAGAQVVDGGPRATRRRPRRARRAARPRPPSPTSPPTSPMPGFDPDRQLIERALAARRLEPWPRRSASGATSTGATPSAPSRRAAGRASRARARRPPSADGRRAATAARR